MRQIYQLSIDIEPAVNAKACSSVPLYDLTGSDLSGALLQRRD